MINIITLDIKEAMDIVSLFSKAKFLNNRFSVSDYKNFQKYQDLLSKKIKEELRLQPKNDK